MLIGLYPGSFDPITNGHVDVLKAALSFCDKVIVAVGINAQKNALFSFEEKLHLIKKVGEDLLGAKTDHLEVISFDTLVVDVARRHEASLIIRGLRDGTDLDYEMQLSSMNSALAPELQTVFLPASISGRAITSTLVRQIAAMGGDVSLFVPPVVAQALKNKFSHQ